MNEFERLLYDNRNPPTTQCFIEKSHDAHDWWYTSYGGGHMMSSIKESDLQYEKGLKKHHCDGVPFINGQTNGVWEKE